MTSMRKVVLVALVLAAAMQASGAVVGLSGVTTQMYLPASAPASDPMVSFDFAADGTIYYSTGDGYWGKKLNVYRHDASGDSLIFSNADVYAGSWVQVNGSSVYFTEDSNYRVYRHDIATGQTQMMLQQANLWGVFFRRQDMYASGADANWSNRIFHANLDASGQMVSSISDLGNVGEPSGPIAFDAEGNLYYAGGYWSGKILRYSAAELAAAVADPANSSLSDPAAHVWANFGDLGYDGASCISFDPQGNLLATLTCFGSPSLLVRFNVNDLGELVSRHTLATSEGRLYAVRSFGGELYVNDGSGIYVVPEPATLALLAGGLIALRRSRSQKGNA